MDAGEPQRDDLVRERLREATSGDATVRQLRRRYDSLRHDYERLLDRLADLEERLGESERSPIPPAAAAPGDPLAGVYALLFAPLLSLRDSYVSAGIQIDGVVAAIDQLTAGSRDASSTSQLGTATSEPPPPEQQPSRSTRPTKVHLDVRGRGFGDLLDFQERLSAVTGVSRVSINAIDADRATLIVELEQATPPSDG